MVRAPYASGKFAALAKFALSAEELAQMGMGASHADIRSRIPATPDTGVWDRAGEQQMIADLHQQHQAAQNPTRAGPGRVPAAARPVVGPYGGTVASKTQVLPALAAGTAKMPVPAAPTVPAGVQTQAAKAPAPAAPAQGATRAVAVPNLPRGQGDATRVVNTMNLARDKGPAGAGGMAGRLGQAASKVWRNPMGRGAALIGGGLLAGHMLSGNNN